MFLADITTSITNFIQSFYVHTGLAGILLAMAIESCCIPLPSEIVMPLAGVMLASGKILSGLNPVLGLLLVALAGAIGCLTGSIAAYGIGYAGGRPLMLKYGRYVLISQHDANKADEFFQRHGSATAFFSRLLPVVRTYISLPAGITRMPFGKFCLYTFLGSFPWCLLLAYIGTVIGNNLSKLNATLGPIFHDLDIVIIVAVVALVALYIWRHIRNDRKARAALAAAASDPVASQQSLMQNGWERHSQQGWSQQVQPPQGSGQSVPTQSSQQPYRGQQVPQPPLQQQGWNQPPQEPPQQPFGQQQSWGRPVPPQPPQPSQPGWGQPTPTTPPQWGRIQSPPQEQWPSPNGHNGWDGPK